MHSITSASLGEQRDHLGAARGRQRLDDRVVLATIAAQAPVDPEARPARAVGERGRRAAHEIRVLERTLREAVIEVVEAAEERRRQTPRDAEDVRVRGGRAEGGETSVRAPDDGRARASAGEPRIGRAEPRHERAGEPLRVAIEAAPRGSAAAPVHVRVLLVTPTRPHRDDGDRPDRACGAQLGHCARDVPGVVAHAASPERRVPVVEDEQRHVASPRVVRQEHVHVPRPERVVEIEAIEGLEDRVVGAAVSPRAQASSLDRLGCHSRLHPPDTAASLGLKGS
jgi:hypothetical protein